MVARQAELLATSEELSAQLSVKAKMAAQVARAALSVAEAKPVPVVLVASREASQTKS
jgi:hypothetical protein